MGLDFVHFLSMLALSGLLIRFVQLKLPPDSDLKKALTFIY